MYLNLQFVVIRLYALIVTSVRINISLDIPDNIRKSQISAYQTVDYVCPWHLNFSCDHEG